CSGVLIAPDAVLTAGHCLYNRVLKDWQHPEAILFVAGLNRDTFQASVRGRAIEHADTQYDKTMPTVPQIAHDWAILRLQQALTLKPLKVRTLPLTFTGGQSHLLRAGYSVDRPFLLSLHEGCQLRERLAEDRILLTDCDSTYGDSGSPLLVKEGSDYWIVGVSSAIVKRGRHPGSYAVHASVFLNRLKGIAGSPP
ncbi:MAG: trypsin-like serine peptidase, partial [Methylococcaceae bacterium]